VRSSYVVKRICGSVAIVWLAVTLNFLIFRALPGTAVSDWSRVPGFTLRAQQALRHEFGLDRSLVTQYVVYVKALLHGNFGVSFVTRQPVGPILLSALGNSIPMLALGQLFAIIGGIALGTLAAWRHGSRTDSATVGAALTLYALPTQWVGLLLLFLCSGFLPAGGQVNPFLLHPSFLQHQLDILRHMILPSATLGLVTLGAYVLIARASLTDVLTQDYILTARAKGFSSRHILRRYGVRNAMLPLVTLIGLSVALLPAGQILVETVFSWPGIGFVTYNAVLQRDYPVLQGAFLVLTVSVVVANLVVDLLYARLDPRVGTT
jgi:peptide/nickel transport system permease protein